MGLDMDDPIHALIIATGWRKQVIESMVKAYEANDVRVLNFEASLAAPWYSFDAQGMYDPKKSFMRLWSRRPWKWGYIGWVSLKLRPHDHTHAFSSNNFCTMF